MIIVTNLLVSTGYITFGNNTECFNLFRFPHRKDMLNTG